MSLESADITYLLTLRDKLTSQVKELEAVIITPPKFDGESIIMQQFSEMEVNQNIEKAELIAEFDKKCAVAKADHENKEAEAKAYNETLVAPLRAKHQQLISNKSVKSTQHRNKIYWIATCNLCVETNPLT